MKKLLLTVVSILFVATSFAQNALVASLSHGTTTTYYYGVNALQQAVAAAESGDIINLSGGTFNATNISKAITMRGAGIDSNSPTYIAGNFNIGIASDDANRFMMEGIRCFNEVKYTGTFSNPYFIKCQFYSLRNYDSSDAISNIMVVNCKITNDFSVGGTCSAYLINSFIKQPDTNNTSSITAQNCLITKYPVRGIINSKWTNCIFYGCTYADALPNSNTATNCINVENSYDVYKDLSEHTNCPSTIYKYTDVFKDFNGEYSDQQTFELTDAFKEAFKGSDGTEVGLYGGLQPYSSTPSYPLITTMTVDKQTTTDGKLGVTVAVSK